MCKHHKKIIMKKSRSALYLVIITIFSFSVSLNAQEQFQGPGTYKILKEGAKSIKVPFRMHNGKTVFDVEINGEKAALMIDNGVLWDEVWLFGTPIVDKLNLKPIEEGLIEGAGEGDPTSMYTSNNIEINFGDVVFYEQPTIVSPAAAGFGRMFPGTDGQICNTFFKHFIVEFDFVENYVILHDPKTYEFTKEGSVLEMKLNDSGTHAVPFEFTMNDGNTFKDWTDIDYGGIYAFKIALNSKNVIKLPENVEKARSFGAQGVSHEYKGKIKSMKFGDYTFDNPTVYFGDEGTSRIHPNNLGVVGLPLFMRFNTTFDYFNMKIYISPNKHLEEPFE